MIISRSYVNSFQAVTAKEAKEKRSLKELLQRTESLVERCDSAVAKIQDLDNSQLDENPAAGKVIYNRLAAAGDENNLWEVRVFGQASAYEESVEADLSPGNREIEARCDVPHFREEGFILRDHHSSGLTEYRGQTDIGTAAKVMKREIPGQEPSYEVLEGGWRIFLHDTFGI